MKNKQHVTTNSNPKSKNPENEETKEAASGGGDVLGSTTREPSSSPTRGDDLRLGKKRKHPSEFIQRTPNDVLCGRGIPIQNYHGNIRLHRIVDSFRDEYLATSRRDKPDLIRRIVATVKEGGARFLKRKSTAGNSRHDHWEEMDDSYAYEKVSHALRCRRYVDNSVNDDEAPHSSDASQLVVPVDVPLSTHPAMGSADAMWRFLKGGSHPQYSASSSSINLSSVDSMMVHSLDQKQVDSATIQEIADHQAKTRRLLEFENQRSTLLGTTFPRPTQSLMPNMMFGSTLSAAAFPHSASVSQVSSNVHSQVIAGLMNFPLRPSLYSNTPLNPQSTAMYQEPQSTGFPSPGAAQRKSSDGLMNDYLRDGERHVDHLAESKSLHAGRVHPEATKNKQQGGIIVHGDSLEKKSLVDQHGSEKGEQEGHPDDDLGARNVHSHNLSQSLTGGLGGPHDTSSSYSMLHDGRGPLVHQWQLDTTNFPQQQAGVSSSSTTPSSTTGTGGLLHPQYHGDFGVSNRIPASLLPSLQIPLSSGIASSSSSRVSAPPPFTALAASFLNPATRYQGQYSSIESGSGGGLTARMINHDHDNLHDRYHPARMLYHQQPPLSQLLLGSGSLWPQTTMMPPPPDRIIVAGQPGQERTSHATRVVGSRTPSHHHDDAADRDDRGNIRKRSTTTSSSGNTVKGGESSTKTKEDEPTSTRGSKSGEDND